MELRKIQKTGGTTYVVSLPKKWVKSENLDRGSVLSIEELRDGALRVSPKIEREKEAKQAEIPVSENLQRHIIEKYLLGYDKLLIKSPTKLSEKQKAQLKRTSQKLIGFEILEETSSSLMVQNLLDPKEISIRKSLRRMYSILSVMHRDLITGIENRDRGLLRDVIQRDSEVNILYFLVVRQIRTVIQNARLQEKEGIKAVDCVDYRLVAKIMENLGDSLEDLAGALLSSKFRGSSAFKKPLEEAFEIHKSAATALFKRDAKLATGAQALYSKFSKKSLKAKTRDQIEILNNLERIAGHGKDLADIVVSG